MKVIGITGGIGSGKSTVSQYLETKGYKILDADKIARSLLNKGEAVYEALLERFGRSILDEKDNIIREKVSDIVFNNKEDLDFLNDVSHRKVEEDIILKLREFEKEKLVFLDVPLLFEAGVDKYCDYVWMIFIDEKIKIERTMKRDNISKAKVKSIIDNQMADAKKIKMSDEVIENNEDIDSLLRKIDRILLKYEQSN